MKMLNKPLRKTVAVTAALGVAGTAAAIAIPRPEDIYVEHKLPDHFEISEGMTIGFNGSDFVYSEGLPNNTDEVIEGLLGDDFSAFVSENVQSDEYIMPGYEIDGEIDTDPENYQIEVLDGYSMLIRYTGIGTIACIPDGVQEISGHTFENCEKLTAVIIPDSVTVIAMDAFVDCEKLEKIYYNGNSDGWSRVEIDAVLPENIGLTLVDMSAEKNEDYDHPVETSDIPEETADTSYGDTTDVPEDSSDTSYDDTTDVPEDSSDTSYGDTTDVPEDNADTSYDDTTDVPEDSSDTSYDDTTAVPEESSDNPDGDTTDVPEESSDTSYDDTTVVPEETSDTSYNDTAYVTDNVSVPSDTSDTDTTVPPDVTGGEVQNGWSESSGIETSETEVTSADLTESTSAENSADVSESTEETTADTHDSINNDETTAVPDADATADESLDTTSPAESSAEEGISAPYEDPVMSTATSEETEGQETGEETEATEETATAADETEDAVGTDGESETTGFPAETAAPEATVTAMDKTVSLVSTLSGISSGKTTLAARMSYFPVSSVISISNTEFAQASAIAAADALDIASDAFYSFDISVYSTETGEQLHKLDGEITFSIAVPDMFAGEDSINVYHIDNGIPQLLTSYINTDIAGNRKVEFYSDTFSPFMFTSGNVVANYEQLPRSDENEAPESATEKGSESDSPFVGENNADISEAGTDIPVMTGIGAEGSTVAGVSEEPIIKITFPTSSPFIINPYHLKIDTDESGTKTSTDDIISPEYRITSESNCKVDVYVEAKAYNVSDSIRLSDSVLLNGETEKYLLLPISMLEGMHQNRSA